MVMWTSGRSIDIKYEREIVDEIKEEKARKQGGKGVFNISKEGFCGRTRVEEKWDKAEKKVKINQLLLSNELDCW